MKKRVFLFVLIVVSSCVIEETPPDVPANVRASDGVYAGKILIQWDGVENAGGYRVFRKASEEQIFSQIADTSYPNYEDKNVVGGLVYTYKVKAYNDMGESDFSKEDTGWAVPDVDSDVKASDGDYPNGIMVSWNAVEGDVEYKLFRGTSSNEINLLLCTTKQTQFFDTNVVLGQVYYYCLSFSKGEQDFKMRGVDSGYAHIDVPAGVSASDGSYADRVVITWGAVSGAVSYRVYRGDSSASATNLIAEVVETQYVDTNIAVNTTYWYSVSAVNGIGETVRSSADSGYAQLDPPSVVSASSNKKECITISWSSVSGATSYKVYRSRDGVNYEYLFEVSGTSADDRSFTNQSVQLGFWHYKVKSVNSKGESEFSSDVIGKALGWRVITVDTSAFADYTSIALDNSGLPHISYTHKGSTRTDLYHAYTNSSGWHTEFVDNASSSIGNDKTYSSLAVDSLNRIHISYRYYNASADYRLREARNGGSWTLTDVEGGCSGVEYTSIAVDSSGYPHISYYRDNSYLKYAYEDSVGWHTETVDNPGGHVGLCTSIVLDSNDKPHISYFDDDNNKLKYAEKTGGSWTVEEVDSLGCDTYQTSIAVDSNGIFHIVYCGNYNLKHAWKESGTWHNETVDNQSGGTYGKYASITVGTDGCLFVSYRKTDDNSLKVAWKEPGGSWTNDVVATNCGGYTSIAISPDGEIHISYISTPDNNLMYAEGYVR